jgi:hypothetical protein
VLADTHTQTHTHQFFYCFIVFRDLNNVQKSHKKWGNNTSNSNASRSNNFFTPPFSMTFLDVIEVPKHDKAIKKLVCMCLCVCVCLCTCQHDYFTFLLYFKARNGAKISVISMQRVESLLSNTHLVMSHIYKISAPIS